jgi:hypothetical protein
VTALGSYFRTIAARQQSITARSSVAAIYNRFQYATEMRDAIEMWDKHLKKLLA